jgi:GNAT superfamily N-acetyltransferase
MGVALRPSAPSDELLMLRVYAATRETELAGVPWTNEHKNQFVAQQFAAQSAHYARHYTGMSSDVVLVDAEPAGRLLVARWPEEIRIVDVSLLPAFRGRGVGTGLLKDLQEEADATGKVLTIHVEKFNPALRLYERLGFVPVQDKEVYLLMEWKAPARQS